MRYAQQAPGEVEVAGEALAADGLQDLRSEKEAFRISHVCFLGLGK
jgi:hypothetical protein